MNESTKPNNSPDSNPDPITGQPGAHPVGTGVGAAGAGAAGAAVGGLIGGPVGAVIGAVVGAVSGGLAGKQAAEAIDPTIEDEYWRTNHTTQPYVEQGRKYEDYQPAYRTGYENYTRLNADKSKAFDEVEPELKSDYEKNYSGTGLTWEQAKPATKDAWNRADTNIKLYEERLVADKQRAKTGEVTIGKRVETETAKVSVPIEKERVVIERTTPVNAGTVSATEANFGGGEVARVEVYEEKADVRKEAFLREEVNIRKEVDKTTVEAQETLRREELDLDAQGRTIEEKTGKNLTDRI